MEFISCLTTERVFPLLPYLFSSVFLVKSGGELMVSSWECACKVFAQGKQVMCFKVAMSAMIQVKCLIENRVKFLAPCATFK